MGFGVNFLANQILVYFLIAHAARLILGQSIFDKPVSVGPLPLYPKQLNPLS
jgi:hypothetical protein